MTRHEMMEEFYTTISPALITRVKERKENVKADIFHVYQALLRVFQDPNRMEAEEGPVLQGQVGNIVKALYRQMKEKSIKTRADLRPLDISQTTFSLYPNNIYQCLSD